MRTIAALLLSLFIAGCGGGGGSSPSTPPPVALQTPDISWPEPAAIRWGTALSAAQLNATSPVAGNFTYTPTSGSQPEVGTQALSVRFTPQDATRYAAVTITRNLRVDKAVPALRWDTPAAVAQSSALAPASLTTQPRALYGVQGAVDATSYARVDGQPLASTTASAGSVVLRARFVPTNTARYEAAWVSTLLSVKPAAASAVVDFAATRQTIDGFGGSAAWYYTPMDAARADVLFGTGADALGLNILRLRIAPAAWNAATETADTGAWAAEMGNAVAAQARGAKVFASAWSPPASLKIVHPERRDPTWSGRLDPAHYAAYAKYLNAYVRYAATRGVALHAISPQNEPDWDPTDYESCLWNADELRSWIAQHGATAVAGSSTLLMAPESLNFSPATTEALLADPQAAARIGVLGGHLYGGVPQLSPAMLARGVPVWMTEHFLDSVNKSDTKASWATDIDDALAIAHEVHESLAHGQYNAYVHWWLVNSNDAKPTGLIDASNKPNHFGLGLKHYSYFVRPGFVRVDATARPADGVGLSAYGGTDGKAAIVLLNESAEARTLTVAVAGRSVASWTPFRTSATASFEKLAPIAATTGAFSITLPARSLTTLVP
jgi:O-glycosyl hydrolase